MTRHTGASAKVRVVAAVIEKDGKVLVCQRPTHKRHGGLWEFPGGKVERGESDFEAVVQLDRLENGADLVVAIRPFPDNLQPEIDLGEGAESEARFQGRNGRAKKSSPAANLNAGRIFPWSDEV